MILIFTNKEDTHPTPVIEKLREWGVPFFRFNTECLLTDYSFKWWCDENGSDFHLRSNNHGAEIYGHEVSAIWERRAQSPKTFKIKTDAEEINHMILDEARGFLSFLRYYLKDVFSIGSIVYDRVVSSKMLQLSLAQKLGMAIPSTMFSNDKTAYESFFARCKTLSLKPIDSDSIFVNGDEEYVFYSQKRSAYEVFSQPSDSFEQTPSFIQEYVDKQYELRVTVCCGEIIACKIDSQAQNEGEGKEDWRQGYEYGLKHEIVDIPVTIQSFCNAFLQEAHIKFGCFDFIVTPNDKYVFLECNPNGQWYWIELETGAPISEMIARHLANPPKTENSR